MPFVNKPACFSINNFPYMLSPMNYGERLRMARLHAHLSQAELAEQSGVTQPTVSQLENSTTDNGSAHTVRFARACGISPDWLDDENGEMIPAYFSTTDPKIIAACRLMEPLPEYAKDMAVKELAQVTELIANVRANHSHG